MRAGREGRPRARRLPSRPAWPRPGSGQGGPLHRAGPRPGARSRRRAEGRGWLGRCRRAQDGPPASGAGGPGRREGSAPAALLPSISATRPRPAPFRARVRRALRVEVGWSQAGGGAEGGRGRGRRSEAEGGRREGRGVRGRPRRPRFRTLDSPAFQEARRKFLAGSGRARGSRMP